MKPAQDQDKHVAGLLQPSEGPTLQNQKVLTLFCMSTNQTLKNYLLKLPLQHTSLYSLHAPHFSYLTKLQIPNSCTSEGKEWLFLTYPLLLISQSSVTLPLFSPSGNEKFWSTHPAVSGFWPSLSPLILSVLSDVTRIRFSHGIQDEGSPSIHTDIVIFPLLYSTPFLIAFNFQFDLLNVIQHSVINIARI